MEPNPGATQSIWMRTADVQKQEASRGAALEQDAQADVCIVGAGIAGVTTAYLLTRAGQSVILIDGGEMGNGETSRTTAHLASALDSRYFELERLHGRRGAQLAAESHTAAILQIETLVQEEDIACEFERISGYLFGARGEDDVLIQQELEAALRAGVPGVERLARAPLASFDTGACLHFPRQGQFSPLRYLSGLARALERRGGRIFTGTHAASIQGGRDAMVTTAQGKTIKAGAVVVATHVPVNDFVTMHTKQAAYRTYVVGMGVPRGAVTRGLYWDTLDPYHYLRLESQGEFDILIVGGEDHKTGQAEDRTDRFARLAGWTRERFPMVQDVMYSWSGQVMQPMDGLAFIGKNPGDEPNVYIVTGNSGNGMTYGTIAGLLLTDLMLGKENPWATLYDPARITLGAVGEFARENVNVAAQYIDLLTGGEVDGAEEIPRGSGAILRDGLSKIATYRDDEGRVHRSNAFCPHLGCVVAWNPAEKTWDCPCHGSRFGACGDLINGPALSGLAPV